MNQSGKNKREVAMPGKFDILVQMDRDKGKKAEDELRMFLGSTSVINQSERALLSKLAKEQKESDKAAKDSR